MEYEEPARQLCCFDSHLTGKEADLLKNHAEASHAFNDGDSPEPAQLNVDRDGKCILAKISKEQAGQLARFYEHIAVQCAESGDNGSWITPVAFRLATRFCSRALGFLHPETIDFLNRLALSLERERLLNDALPLYRFVLEFCDTTFGNEHQRTPFALMNLADCLVRLGEYSEALPLRRRQLELFQAQPSDNNKYHEYIELSLVGLAECLRKLGMTKEELPLRQELLKQRTSRFGNYKETTLDTLHNLAACHQRAQSPAKALELFQKEINGWAACDTPSSRKSLEAMNAIGVCLMNLGRFVEATPAFEKAIAIAEAAGLEDDPIAIESEEFRTESIQRWSTPPAKGTYETNPSKYSKCMEQFTQREFAEFLKCAMSIVNESNYTLTMMQAILISLQRLGEESMLRAIIPQLFATMKDPWQRSLICLTLGLEESTTIQAAAKDTNQSTQAHYYNGCRLLTQGRVEEARSEFEIAQDLKANNEEWLFSMFELGHSDLSIKTVSEAAHLVDGATWEEFRPTQKTNSDSKAEMPPFTISEIMDQLIKNGIPHEEWEQVTDELNAHGKAFFTALEYQGVPLDKGTRLEYSLQRISTDKGLIYKSLVILPVQNVGHQLMNKPSHERIIDTEDGLPSQSPSGLVADDRQAWVSYQNGKLFCIDGKTGIVETLPAKEGHSHDKITSLHLSHHFLWVGSDMGLSCLDVKQGNWKIYAFDAGSINAMQEEGDSLWALSDSHLVHLDLPREELRSIPLPMRGDSKALAVVDGEVWCGFDEERATLFRFDIQNESWHQIYTTMPYVLSLLHEPIWHEKGDLWVGTCRGVELVERHSGSTETFRMQDCGMIHSIARIGEFMIFGTKNGLVGIDFTKEAITKHTQAPQYCFIGQHVMKVSGGKQYMWAAVSGKGIAYVPLQTLREH